MEKNRKRLRVDVTQTNQLSYHVSSETLLNHDCLVKIFNNLPIIDRIRLERVCKRWYQASRGSWSNVKKLDTWYFFFSNREIPPKSSKEIYKKILSRCGYFINKICIFKENFVMGLVLKMCPNLEEVHFYSIGINVLRLLTTYKGLKLTHLKLSEMSRHCNDEFLEIILPQLCLEKFSIYQCQYFTGSCLKNLSAEHIQEINLDRCYSLDWPMTLKILQNLKNLQKLELKGFHRHSNDFINTIQKLNLKELNISENEKVVNDDFLIKLVPALSSLTKFDISGNLGVTDVGLSAVSELSNLEYLDISYLPKIKGEVFMNFPKLKHTYLGCSCTTEGKLNILKSSDKLEVMSLSSFSCNDKKFFDAAVKLVNKPERNGIILNINIHGDQESLSSIKHITHDTPFLKCVLEPHRESTLIT